MPLAFLEPNIAALNEVFQRRNLIVHNGSRINAYYLNRVDPNLREGLKPGDAIAVTKDYLRKAIDLIEADFILIAVELWRKWDKHSIERSDTLAGVAFEQMLAERWEVSRRLSAFLMDDKAAPEANRLRGQINYWQSIKRAGDYESDPHRG